MSFKKKKLPNHVDIVTSTSTGSGPIDAERYFAQKARNRFMSFVWIIGVSLLIGFIGFVALAKVSGMRFDIQLPSVVTRNLPFLKTEPKEEKLNILLTGVGGAGHDGTDLTDTIILASVNRRSGTVSMLSIPRDLYVEIPAGRTTSRGKINEVYFRALKNSTPEEAMRALEEKVTEITGEPIDRYLNIDFAGFRKFVDVLGGIEVDVPEDIVDYEYPDNNWGYQTFRIKKGFQQLDGSTALKYVRSRHSTSDFDRSARQQLVLKAIKDKLFSLDALTSPSKLSSLYSAITSHIKTDVSFDEILELAVFAKNLENSKILSFNLNDGCFQSASFCNVGGFLYTPAREQFWGSSVLLPNGASASDVSEYSVIRKFANLIYNYPELYTEGKEIVIVNATRQSGLANSLAMTLKRYGFPVPEKNSISSTKDRVGKTEVRHIWDGIDPAGTSPDSVTLSALRLFVNTPPQPEAALKYSTLVWPQIEIILGDDAKTVLTELY